MLLAYIHLLVTSLVYRCEDSGSETCVWTSSEDSGSEAGVWTPWTANEDIGFDPLWRRGERGEDGVLLETVLLLYTAIRTLRDAALPSLARGPSTVTPGSPETQSGKAICEDTWLPVESPQKHILLFATTAQRLLLHWEPPFEPLHLRLCFMETYIRPEPQEHVTASFFRRSPVMPLCTPPVWPDCGESTRPWVARRIVVSQELRGSLNLTLASASCRSKGHVAIKTIGDLRTLVEDPRLDLKVIHLVRDPRAILASRMMAFSGSVPRLEHMGTSPGGSHVTCKDMAASAAVGLQRPVWLRGRYLLVRYEDLAFNPEDKASEIYRLWGWRRQQGWSWISRNTNSDMCSASEWNYRYSTSRDSRATRESWEAPPGL
ncbi:hypothetical protein CRUP_017910 [Coryphaenoides rupestris]|nr:hypothetical protein CRUP_017910 [Coryphaenoides rupestris]